MKKFNPHFATSLISSSSSDWHRFGICSLCSSKFLSWLLHSVHHNGSFLRLCMNCLLKNHPSLFCPICIEVFEPNNPPSPRHRQMCLNCPSISHISCVQSNSACGFLCPSCSDPNFKIFNPSSTSSNTRVMPSNLDAHDKDSHGDSNYGPFFNIEAAKAFVAAAKIAAVLLTNAAMAAKADAERKAEEAVSAKKKAKEALDKLSQIVGKENEKEKTKEPRGGSQKTKSKASKNGVVLVGNGKASKLKARKLS